MTKCKCEFAKGSEVPIQECQLHREMRLKIERLQAQIKKFDDSCLENFLLDAIKAWYGGSGRAHRGECLEALSSCTIAVLMSEEVPNRSEQN